MDIDTSYGYSGTDWAYFSSTERKWINQIYALAQSNPDDVQIIKRAEDNNGCVYCRLKPSMMKLSARRKRVISDEEREAARERIRKANEIRLSRNKREDEEKPVAS